MNRVTGQGSYVAGGIPDLSELPVGSVSGLPIPFRGCVRQVSLNWRRTALDRDHILAARNIADCDGTRCGGDICEHGGSCWLDKHHMAHCSCLQVTHNIIHQQQQQQGTSHSRLVLSSWVLVCPSFPWLTYILFCQVNYIHTVNCNAYIIHF